MRALLFGALLAVQVAGKTTQQTPLLCAAGRTSSRHGVCCPATCGFCGGHACKRAAADRERCCPSAILRSRRCCEAADDVAADRVAGPARLTRPRRPAP